MRKAGTLSTALALCILGGCAVPVSFLIAGVAFRIGLELLESFRVAAGGEPVLQAARIDLAFPTPPADRPLNASFDLDARHVQAVPLDVAKARPLQQSVAGEATIDLLVASAMDDNPCSDGVPAGQFSFSFDGTNVSIRQGSFVLPPVAFDLAKSGSFTLCLGVSANVDAAIAINEIGVSFGPAAASCQTDGSCDSELPACINGFCPFGRYCNTQDKCSPITCFRSCPFAFLACGDDGKCAPFPCQVDSVEICSRMGLTCVEGQCVPFPCEATECHFGTGCNPYNECAVIGCDSRSPCPSSLECERGACVEHECGLRTSCPPNLRCDNGLCRPNNCVRDTDCPSGIEVCNSFGQCVPPRCTNSECPFPLSCDDYTQCVPTECDDTPIDAQRCPAMLTCNDLLLCAEQACGPAKDCPPTLRCDNGRCLPNQCQMVSDCLPGQICNGLGECAQFTCSEQSTCPFGLGCNTFNQCIASECGNNLPCSKLLTCDESLRLCVPPTCGLGKECPTGLICDNGQCVPRECAADSSCPPGLRCNDFGQCIPTRQMCRLGSKCDGECMDESECLAGEVCTDGFCESAVGNCIPGFNCDTECVFDSDCPPDMGCNDFFVCYDPSKVECAFASDCPTGQTCNIRFQCE